MLDLYGSSEGPELGTFVCVEMCEISQLCEDLLALQELVWPMNLVTCCKYEECMLLLQLKFNVHLPYIMEGSAGSIPTSQCLNQNSDWLTGLLH